MSYNTEYFETKKEAWVFYNEKKERISPESHIDEPKRESPYKKPRREHRYRVSWD
jgi:hypothetical protein